MTSITLFVGDLSYFCNESNLIELFSCYGHVERAIIRRSREGMTLNYGFVTITKDSALNPSLIDDLEGKLFLGRHLRVNIQNQNATKPFVSPRKAPISYQVYIRFQSDVVNARVDETTLLSIFSVYGTIVDCIVKEHTLLPETHRTCGYAFLYFEEKEGAARAVAATNRAEDIQTTNNNGVILPTGMVVNNVLYKCSFPKVLTQSTNVTETNNIASEINEDNNISSTKTLESDDSMIPSADKSLEKIHAPPSLQPCANDKLGKQDIPDAASTIKSVASGTSPKVGSTSAGASHTSIVHPQMKKLQPFPIDHNKDKVSSHPSPRMIQYSLSSHSPSYAVPKAHVLSSYPMGATQTTVSPLAQPQLQSEQHSSQSSMMIMMPPTEVYPTNIHPHNNNSFMHTSLHHHQHRQHQPAHVSANLQQLYLLPLTPTTSYSPTQSTGTMAVTNTTNLVPGGTVPFINQANHPNMQQPMYYYPTPVPGTSVFSASAPVNPTDHTVFATNNFSTTALYPTSSPPPYPSTANNASYVSLQQHTPVDYHDQHPHQNNTNTQLNNHNYSYPMQSMVIPVYPTQQSILPNAQAYIPSPMMQYPHQQQYINNHNNSIDTHNNQISMYMPQGHPPNSHVAYPMQGMQTTVPPPGHHAPMYHSHSNSNHIRNMEKNVPHNNASAGTM